MKDPQKKQADKRKKEKTLVSIYLTPVEKQRFNELKKRRGLTQAGVLLEWMSQQETNK